MHGGDDDIDACDRRCEGARVSNVADDHLGAGGFERLRAARVSGKQPGVGPAGGQCSDDLAAEPSGSSSDEDHDVARGST